MNEITPLSQAQKALAMASTPQESKQVEAMSKAAISWAKEMNDFGLLIEAFRVYLLSRRKTTELIEPQIGKGGNYSKLGNIEMTQLSDFSLTKQQMYLRRKELSVDINKISEYLDRCKRLKEEPTIKGMLLFWMGILSSDDEEWWTPKEYMDAVHAVMGGIDLDPASNAKANGVVMAKNYYTKDDDGLKQQWGGRVFLNPPYGKAGPPFINKLIVELGNTVTEAIVLVNSRATDAEWFQPMFDGIICFTDHRIDFDSPEEKQTSSTHGSCFIYFGPNKAKFAKVFSGFGNVMRRYDA